MFNKYYVLTPQNEEPQKIFKCQKMSTSKIPMYQMSAKLVQQSKKIYFKIGALGYFMILEKSRHDFAKRTRLSTFKDKDEFCPAQKQAIWKKWAIKLGSFNRFSRPGSV
jgi:hypothetical protein